MGRRPHLVSFSVLRLSTGSRFRRSGGLFRCLGSQDVQDCGTQEYMIEDNTATRPAMSSSQRFCLRWNNHQSNLLSVFDQLLHDESFVDVTLAVEGLFLKAHKMVLSACSPYFQTLFVHNPDKHPIVILKDVPYADMRSLLDFMYRGEVSVDQDRLTAFLRVAESLRIKGLTEVNEERCDLPTITSSLLSSAAAAAASSASTPPPQMQPQTAPPSHPAAVSTPPVVAAAPSSTSPIALTSTPPPPSSHPVTPTPPSSILERPSRPPPPPAIPIPPKRSAPSPVPGAPPKRKRGRPRKLSGGEQGTKRPQGTTKTESSTPSATATSESGASGGGEKLGRTSPSADRSEGKSSEGSRSDREHKPKDAALALDGKVKDDPEPTPGTSTQDVAQGYGSSTVTPDAEAYASVEAEGEDEEEEEEEEDERGEIREEEEDEGEVKIQMANDSHGHGSPQLDEEEEWKEWKEWKAGGGNWGSQIPWEDRMREGNAASLVQSSTRGTPSLPAPPPLLPLPPPPIHLYPIQRPARRRRRPASRNDVPLPPPLRGQPQHTTTEDPARPNHNLQDGGGGETGEVDASAPQPQQVQARTSTGENIRTFRTALGQNLYQCLVCGVTYRHRGSSVLIFTVCLSLLKAWALSGGSLCLAPLPSFPASAHAILPPPTNCCAVGPFEERQHMT
ncbi:hypothetical protein J437_LFUL002480 [Ladona fulva]|uniref:BTB domain-containing protein n=1 Tax=Ladona fulva TaxID=123851 RepID=A0A8K0JT26_LADFU|nr:hypothetical protein J437_LFUL002480 [Ladona fulva]